MNTVSMTRLEVFLLIIVVMLVAHLVVRTAITPEPVTEVRACLDEMGNRAENGCWRWVKCE